MISVPARLNVKEEIPKRMMDNFDWNLRCASPGIIESFDKIKQTVTVRVAIAEMIRCNDPSFVAKHGNNNVAPVAIPILLDVPIVVPRAGGFAVTLPIKPGDECLVIFSDTCIDSWYQNGCKYGQVEGEPGYMPEKQMSLRRHDLSDGFAILGTWSQPHVISDYSEDSLQVRSEDGLTVIEVKDGEVNVTAKDAVNVTAKEINLGDGTNLYQLIDQRIVELFNEHVHLYSPGPGSSTPSAVPTVQLALADVATGVVKGK